MWEHSLSAQSYAAGLSGPHNGKLGFNAFGGEHLLVLGLDITRKIRGMQVVGQIYRFKSALLKILQRLGKQFVVIRLEPDFSAVC